MPCSRRTASSLGLEQAGVDDAVVAGSRRGVREAAQELVHARLELGGVDERVDAVGEQVEPGHQGDEARPEAAQAAAHDVDHGAEPIALVRALLAHPAQREHVAFLGHVDPLHDRRAVGAGEPARLDLDAEATCQLQLVVGDLGGADVDHEGRHLVGGGGPGERVRAEARLGAEGRQHHGATAGGHCDADHVVRHGSHRVVAGAAHVSDARDADCSEAVLRGLVDGDVHRVRGDVGGRARRRRR